MGWFSTIRQVTVSVTSALTAKRTHQAQSNAQRYPALVAKHSAYAGYTARLVDKRTGWLPHFACDGLLFNCLYAIACEPRVSIERAQTDDGRLFRTPQHDCYDNEWSDSDISRDMLLGFLLWCWQYKKLRSLMRAIEYGEAHGSCLGWVMGRGDFSRTLATPPVKAKFYQLRHHLLPGSDQPFAARIPEIYGPTSGTASHYKLLSILLDGLLYGGLTANDLWHLRAVIAANPDNALAHAILHRYTDGDQRAAAAILLNPQWFPKDRLPSTAQYCTSYLFQREEYRASGMRSDDWLPCADAHTRTWPAVDFHFAAAVALDKIRR